MAFYNIVSATLANGSVAITMTECNNLGASIPAADYSYAVYLNPTMMFISAKDKFYLVSQNGEKSPELDKDSVITLWGTPHGQSTTVALAEEVKSMILF